MPQQCTSPRHTPERVDNSKNSTECLLTFRAVFISCIDNAIYAKFFLLGQRCYSSLASCMSAGSRPQSA